MLGLEMGEESNTHTQPISFTFELLMSPNKIWKSPKVRLKNTIQKEPN